MYRCIAGFVVDDSKARHTKLSSVAFECGISIYLERVCDVEKVGILWRS